jgi:putative Holliday junction resolvase
MVFNLIIIKILVALFFSSTSAFISSSQCGTPTTSFALANLIRNHVAHHSTSSNLPRLAMINENMSDNLLRAAAELTTDTSSLLGVKSIGVDYGLVRTGLAATCGYEPEPIAIVSDLNNTQLSQKIVKLAESEKASQIILGLPFHTNGTEAEQTIITREFARNLVCAVYAHFGPDKMPIYLWDERYTSKEAAARLRAANPRANTYKELDAEAACIILEYYYEDNGIGAQRVELPDDKNIMEALRQAWEMKKEEDRRRLKELREMRMNPHEPRKAMIERARLLDEKLARDNNRTSVKKKKKKKKKR